MSPPRQNIHATAVVIATTGLIFVGPSGAGKTSVAHSCLSTAASLGLFARLVADDQVFVSRHGGQIIAERPDTIKGLLELRGTGIASLPSLKRARLDYAVMVGTAETLERLPPVEESFELWPDALLPLVRIGSGTGDPLFRLARLIPFLGLSSGKTSN